MGLIEGHDSSSFYLGENDGLGLPGLARMFFAEIPRAFQERKDSQTTNIQETVGCLDLVMDILARTDLGDAILLYLHGWILQ
jgi:hypothetical protein